MIGNLSKLQSDLPASSAYIVCNEVNQIVMSTKRLWDGLGDDFG